MVSERGVTGLPRKTRVALTPDGHRVMMVGRQAKQLSEKALVHGCFVAQRAHAWVHVAFDQITRLLGFALNVVEIFVEAVLGDEYVSHVLRKRGQSSSGNANGASFKERHLPLSN